jgi:hypothetical protein
VEVDREDVLLGRRLWGAETPCAPEESAFCRQDANFGTPQVRELPGIDIRVVANRADRPERSTE